MTTLRGTVNAQPIHTETQIVEKRTFIQRPSRANLTFLSPSLSPSLPPPFLSIHHIQPREKMMLLLGLFLLLISYALFYLFVH